MKKLVIDLEATCVAEGQRSEIIEIGAMVVDDHWRVEGTFDVFVKPVLHPTLSSFCKNLTKISQYEVNNGLPYAAAIVVLENWMEAYGGKEALVFCSWGNYDKNQFKKDCEYHNVPYPFTDKHINLKVAVAKCQKWPKVKGVGNALNTLKMQFEGTPHRGIDDVKNIIRICKQVGLPGGV